MSDTPETDALANIAWDGASDDYSAYAKMLGLARRLECERNELRAKYQMHHEKAERLTDEIEKERAIADSLASELSACKNTFGLPDLPALTAWKEARK